MLKFIVTHQTIIRVDRFSPAEESVNYLNAEFEFRTEEWSGIEKKAICKNRATKLAWDAGIVDDRCLIPWEALVNTKEFSICVHGKSGLQKITTNELAVVLKRTIHGGAESNPSSLTEFEQLKRDVADLKENGTGVGGLIIDSDGEGNVTITASGNTAITSDGAGNVTIA